MERSEELKDKYIGMVSSYHLGEACLLAYTEWDLRFEERFG